MDFARVCQIYQSNPTDDFVTKRISAIKDIKTAIKRKNKVYDWLKIANGVCEIFQLKPDAPKEISEIFEAAIKKHSPSFVAENSSIDLYFTGFVAVIDLIETTPPSNSGWTITDWLAIGIFTSLNNLPACSKQGLEDLKLDTLRILKRRIDESALINRERSNVPEIVIPEKEPIHTAILGTAVEAISALEWNAILDREELNLLWWALAERCVLLDTKLKLLPAPVRGIFSGIEVGRMMCAMPVSAHNHIAARFLDNDNSQFGIEEVVKSFSDYQETITRLFGAVELINQAPNIFPLLNCLLLQKTVKNKFVKKMNEIDWTKRALLETAVLKLAE